MSTIMALAKDNKVTELDDELQAIADKENVLVMSFVAPDSIVKKNPATYDWAQITIKDLYNIEAEISKLQDENRLPPKLHLIIQSPGGALDASVKIAKYLQAIFNEIEAYVPYEAASGGTMLCLASNTIVMDITSDLTPIDPQVVYNGEYVAASSYDHAINDFEEKFPTQRPEELPTPYRQMGDKFDPVIQKEMSKVVWDTMTVALELLKKSQQPENEAETNKLYQVVLTLSKQDIPHSHIISLNEAKKAGLNISSDVDKIKLLRTYKRWVSGMLDQQETAHIIKTFCPKSQQKTKTKKSNK